MAVLNNIGYIICETDIAMDPVARVVGRNGRNKVIAEGIVQTADERNRNGRFYAKEEIFPKLRDPRLIELLNAGYLRAELGHPLSKELVRQQTIDDTKTCAKFLKIWTEGNNIWAQFCGTNNEYGRVFQEDLLDGCKPAWSLRALGSLENTSRGAEVKNLKIITWDQVIYPSHPGAYTQRIVSESAIGGSQTKGVGMKKLQKLVSESARFGDTNDTSGKSKIYAITNKNVMNYIRSESCNIKYMRECFDFMYKEITVNEAASTVTLTDNSGNIFVVNLETHIHNEIMNYCSEVADYFGKD